MGNYVFTTSALVEAVTADHAAQGSAHDVGGNVITSMVGAGDASVYDFHANDVPGSTERDRAYWRDVGTLESYYEAHRDLISADPVFNLYNRDWPIHTWHESLPPAKFIHDEDGRRGYAVNSMISNGAILSGGAVRNSVVSPRAFVHSFSLVEDSILLHGVEVGRGAVVRRAIVDKDVRVPDDARIGVDPDFDRAHFHVSDSGIVVIGKGDQVPPL
jgi:glucose-1-phosphate adenylyltransferase